MLTTLDYLERSLKSFGMKYARITVDLQLYIVKKSKSMSNTRYQIYSGSKKLPKLKKLPPTDANLMLHILRAHLQVMLWKAAGQREPPAEARDISKFGWEVAKEGAVMPALDIQAVAPINLLDVTSCPCSTLKACSKGNCSCHATSISCTDYCKCEGAFTSCTEGYIGELQLALGPKPAEPTTSPDSAFVDTPPATVEGVSSLPEPCGTTSVDNNTAEQTQTKLKTSAQHRQQAIKKKQKTKPAEPTTSPDSAFVDTPPATVEGVSSLPEPCDTKSVDNNTAEQTQTKGKTSAQHRQQTIKKQDESAVDRSSDELKPDGTVDQFGDESEWDSSSVDMGDEYIPPKGECEDSTDDSNGSEEFFDDTIDLISKQKAKKKRTTKKDHTVSSKSRLKLDTLQIAKVSKLLLAMQQGRIGDYIGMNLDEIDISPDESVPTLTPDKEEVQGEDEMGEGDDSEIGEGEDSEIRGGEVMSETRLSNTLPPEIPTQMEVSSSGISSSIKGRHTTTKKPWTKEETSAVERSMSRKFIEKFVVPGKNDCIACINANPEALKERDWRAVKFHVKNKITALKRKAFSH
ncbi:unnamed protein product [Gadus morhua 'NCC']